MCACAMSRALKWEQREAAGGARSKSSAPRAEGCERDAGAHDHTHTYSHTHTHTFTSFSQQLGQQDERLPFFK